MKSSGLQNAVLFEVIPVMPSKDPLSRPSTRLFCDFGALWEPNGTPLGVPGGPLIRHLGHLWTPGETFGTTWGTLSLPKGSRAPKLVSNWVQNQARGEPPDSSLVACFSLLCLCLVTTDRSLEGPAWPPSACLHLYARHLKSPKAAKACSQARRGKESPLIWSCPGKDRKGLEERPRYSAALDSSTVRILFSA